jgi:hypothetical protein
MESEDVKSEVINGAGGAFQPAAAGPLADVLAHQEMCAQQRHFGDGISQWALRSPPSSPPRTHTNQLLAKLAFVASENAWILRLNNRGQSCLPT